MKEYHVINILEGIYEDYVRDNDKEYTERNLALTEAVKALTEIQQYRAIGTVERFKQLAEQFKPHVTDKTSCPERHCNKCDKYRKENEKYHEIGTVEECREARERQWAKKPIIKSKKKTKIQTGDYVDVKCPCCEEDIFSCFHYPPWNDSQKSHKHCENCGQAIDWSDKD